MRKARKMRKINSASQLKNGHKYLLNDHYVSFLTPFVESKTKAALPFVCYCDDPIVYRTREQLFKFLAEHSFEIYEVN